LINILTKDEKINLVESVSPIISTAFNRIIPKSKKGRDEDDDDNPLLDIDPDVRFIYIYGYASYPTIFLSFFLFFFICQ
jgi:hypothetical protein